MLNKSLPNIGLSFRFLQCKRSYDSVNWVKETRITEYDIQATTIYAAMRVIFVTICCISKLIYIYIYIYIYLSSEHTKKIHTGNVFS